MLCSLPENELGVDYIYFFITQVFEQLPLITHKNSQLFLRHYLCWLWSGCAYVSAMFSDVVHIKGKTMKLIAAIFALSFTLFAASQANASCGCHQAPPPPPPCGCHHVAPPPPPPPPPPVVKHPCGCHRVVHHVHHVAPPPPPPAPLAPRPCGCHRDYDYNYAPPPPPPPPAPRPCGCQRDYDYNYNYAPPPPPPAPMRVLPSPFRGPCGSCNRDGSLRGERCWQIPVVQGGQVLYYRRECD